MTELTEIDTDTSQLMVYQTELNQVLSSAFVRPGMGVLLTPTLPEIVPIARLLVLIPDCEVDERELAHTLWSLAERRQLAVMLVGTAGLRSAGYAHRRLINLATQIRDGRLRVETVLRPQTPWLQTVAELRRPGDLIICPAQQRVSLHGWHWQTLGQLLITLHPSPVYLLNKFYDRLPIERPLFWGRLVSWLIPLLVITGFTLLQLWISQWPDSGLYYPMMLLSIFLEVITIGAWEGVF